MSERSMTPGQKNCGTCQYWGGSRRVQSSIVYMESNARAMCSKKHCQMACSQGCCNWCKIG